MVGAVVCVLLTMGCGGADIPDAAVGPSPGPPAAAAADAASSAADSASGEAQGDVVGFLADLDAALADTVWAGEVLESPDVFVATARLFCAQLDAGMTPDEVLVGYSETLTKAPIADASDDTLVLTGSLLGIGVGALCPDHAAIIDESF